VGLVATWFFAGSVPVTMAGCVLMFIGLVFMLERLEDDPLYRYLDERGLLDKPQL
jgi:hypothetical protein